MLEKIQSLAIALKKWRLFFAVAFLFAAAFFIFSALAPHAYALDIGARYAENIGLGNRSPKDIIVGLVQVILGFLGLIAIILIMYAGFVMMTSQGDASKVENAKKILTNAIIGLAIILASWGIVLFVISRWNSIAGGGDIGGGGGGGRGTIGTSALGAGIIESHYPGRGQRGVPRNTVIAITFKEAIDPASLIENTNGNAQYGDFIDLNANGRLDPGEYDTIASTSVFNLMRTLDAHAGPFVSDIFAAVSADHKIFVFDPIEYLGSPSEPVGYTVDLGTGIRKANGDLAFGGVAGGIGYSWEFEVSTVIDDTPPQIESIIPRPGSTEPRNIVIQVNFNEAVNPLSASGASAGQDNLNVLNETVNGDVAGNFYISNQYQTVEFLSDNLCGVNSCGKSVYCLPGNSSLRTDVRASDLLIAGQPTAVFPYNGVVDMANNSLDGNADGTADGPASDCDLAGLPVRPICAGIGDNAFWRFSTNNTILLTAPRIVSLAPNNNEADIGADTRPEGTFSRYLMSRSINSGSAELLLNPNGLINYWLSKTNDDLAERTTVMIRHDAFAENSGYRSSFNSNLQDIYQNCFSPSSGEDDNPNMQCNATAANPSCCGFAPTGTASCP
jgi:hypothetical protein